MDTILSIWGKVMQRLSLFSATDVQNELADTIRNKRKSLKLSREALAQKSTVPAPTIKRFENTGQISLRQFLLLWQCVDELQHILSACKPALSGPQTIADVLQS